MKLGTIDQGISLYGFNQRYVEDLDYVIEDCYREVQRFGVEKFELVAAIFFEQYPRPRADEIERVLPGAERYGLTPFSYGGTPTSRSSAICRSSSKSSAGLPESRPSQQPAVRDPTMGALW